MKKLILLTILSLSTQAFAQENSVTVQLTQNKKTATANEYIVAGSVGFTLHGESQSIPLSPKTLKINGTHATVYLDDYKGVCIHVEQQGSDIQLVAELRSVVQDYALVAEKRYVLGKAQVQTTSSSSNHNEQQFDVNRVAEHF